MSSYKIISERLVSIKLEFYDGPVTIFRAYTRDTFSCFVFCKPRIEETSYHFESYFSTACRLFTFLYRAGALYNIH